MSHLILRLLIALLFSTFTASAVLAQYGPPGTGSNAQFHGQVRYDSGDPAFKILVRLERFDGGLVGQEYTDRNGKFRFNGLKPFTYVVTIHLPGYQDIKHQVELVTRNNDYAVFTLRPDDSSRAPSSRGAAVILDVKVPLEARREFERGRAALLEAGKPQAGIAHLEKAISLYPNFLEAHLMLGTAYMDAGQLEKAEGTLSKALSVNPKAAEAYFALGEVYRQQKKYVEGEKMVREGLKLQERSWQGHFTLGRLYWDTDEWVKAGREVAKTLQLKPDLAEAHLLAGNILLRARKNEDALLEFEEYLRLDPKGKFAVQARDTVAKIKKALAQNKK